ncbi:MAG: NifU family protein [Patescibacteria group bacterium]
MNREKLEKILDSIRPGLVADGGNLNLVDYDAKKGIVSIVLQGACAHCQLADFTAKYVIEAELKAKMPSIKEVKIVKS